MKSWTIFIGVIAIVAAADICQKKYPEFENVAGI